MALAEIEKSMSFTVAIDGPAAAGKGTISKAVAEHFGFAYLDTGTLYRAVGLKTLETGGDPAELARTLSADDLARDDLRTPKAAQGASRVAAIPEVRAALLEFQRSFARRRDGAILDGRDIGTVICPDAEVKLYVTASDEVRSERRFKELTSKGMDVTLKSVSDDLKARDARDAEREAAPMKPATDALLLDTTKLSIDAAVAQAVAHIKTRLEQVGS